MEFYNLQRDRNKKLIKKFFLLYVILMIVKMLSTMFIVQIVTIDKHYLESLTKNSESAQSILNSPNIKRSQKVLILKKFLMNKISFAKFSFKSKELQKGEIVYVKLNDPPFHNNYFHIISNILYILSIGIIRMDSSDYELKRVEGLPGDRIVYSARKLISINGPSKEFFTQNFLESVPFFDSVKELTLSDNEYFLMGTGEFALDDRIFGPTNIKNIKGKAYIRIGNEWTLFR